MSLASPPALWLIEHARDSVHGEQHDAVGRHGPHEARGEATVEAADPTLTPQQLQHVEGSSSSSSSSGGGGSSCRSGGPHPHPTAAAACTVAAAAVAQVRMVVAGGDLAWCSGV